MRYTVGIMIWRFSFVALFFGFFVAPVHAATLYIDPGTAEVFRGDAITLSVRLDTDEAANECINAVDGVITYPDSITPVDISVGKSIFSMWVEPPTIHKENQTITFAGGIPNGYCGRVQGDPNLTNTLVELIFRAPGLRTETTEQNTTAVIDFGAATTAYVNDGQGTKAVLRTIGTTLALRDTVGSQIKDDWKDVVTGDTIIPEVFSIDLQREEKTFDGKYFIVFNTTDKQSGLSHYEVIEESAAESKLFHFGAVTSPWIEAPSPYPLRDQSLRSVIRVKAIDKAGNEYIATLIPDASLRAPFVSSTQLFALFFAVIVAVGATLICLLRANKRKRAKIYQQQP